MYDLPYFKEEDPEIVKQFIREHPFAFVAGTDVSNRPVATQVPVFIDERNGKLYLTGHIMKNTDHHKAFVHNPNVLTIFTGPHTYVSGSWYDNPRQASTWNYMSVHTKGTISFGDEQALIAILKRLTLHYENNNAASTTVFDNLPKEYTDRLMKAIVAFEIEVESMENVFKLSQNRDAKSYDNIIVELRKGNNDAKEIAGLMEQRRSKVFGE